MKKWCLSSMLMIISFIAVGQTNKNNSLIDSLKKPHKTYDNNGVNKTRKNNHQQKSKRNIKASSMMDTLGDKRNANAPDK
ncbi:MAG: hypothetical protein JSS96_06935 [Bacteroidetes bacterium]|nr:hypothetical protein [Bacteroidota bacterium]